MKGTGRTESAARSAAVPALRLGWARLLLALLPLAAIGLLGDTAMRSRFEQRRASFAEEVSDRLERIAVQTDADLAVSQPLSSIAQALKKSRREPDAAVLADRLQSSLPGTGFELFVFDGHGTVSGISPRSAPNQWLMRRLIAGLAADESAVPAIAAELDRRLVPMFGSSRTLQSFRRSRGLRTRMQRMRKPVSLFWDSGPRGGFLVIISSEPDLGKRLSAVWAGEAARDEALGWKTCDSDVWRILGSVRPELPARFWNRLEKQGHQAIDTNKRHWEYRLTSRGDILFLAAPPGSAAARPPLGAWWGIILSTSLIFGYFILCGPDILGSIGRLSILLFVVAAAVPTACAALGGFRVLADRREVLRSEVRRAQVDALKLFDERFEDYLDRFRRKLVRQTSRPAFFSISSSTAEIAAPFVRAPYFGHLELLASGSRTLARIPNTETAFSLLLPHIQRMGLEVLAPRLLATPTVPIDAASSKMMREAQFGFTAVSIRPRRLNPMNTGTSRPMFYWDYPRVPGKDATFAVFVFNRAHLMRDYVSTRILESGALWETKIRLGAHHLDLAEAFPGTEGLWKQLTPALHRSRVLNKPVFGRVRRGGRDWWYTAIVGANIDHYGLIALFPDDRIEHLLSELRFQAYSGMAFMIALAAGLGALLSRRLVRPVSALAEGVANLQQKNFNKPVRIDGQDELARLSAAFNEMVAELKDLDVARAVQSGLLPASYPQPACYSIHGKSVFFGDLGGDCLDSRVLPGGHILLLIGDVSGHGASSALLMAFIKATVTLWSRSGSTDLTLLANRIDGLLRSFPGPKRFLALFCCLLDPVAHTLQWLSGGHPYPLLVRASGESSFLGAPGYPLGIRRTRQAPPTGTVTLEAGDTLFFYTDGFVEALDRSGHPVGYDRMAAMVIEACAVAPPDAGRAGHLLDALLSRRTELAEDWNDDVTLMILARLPGKGAPS